MADGFWVPDGRGGARLPEALVVAIRAGRGGAPAVPVGYRARQLATGRVVHGIGCGYLGPGGCRLGRWKAPLCLTYLCEPVAAALGLAGGDDPDDFAGSRAVFLALAHDDLPGARIALTRLEATLDALDRSLCEAFPDGEALSKAVTGDPPTDRGSGLVRDQDRSHSGPSTL